MQRLPITALLCLACSAPQMALAAEAQDCPFTADYLSQRLDKKLKVVTAGKGLLGKACEYADEKRSVKIAVDAGPNPAPSGEMWRKMSNPPGTKWDSVPNDADKAVTLAAYPNGEPYPALSYERKGWLVTINVMGVSGKAAVGQWNTKLVQLKRLPE